MPTKLDWARLAAYIDGEGSIFIRHRKETVTDIANQWNRGHELHVVINNCDPRLLVWCKDKFGGCVYQASPDTPGVGKKYLRPRRASFQWLTSTTKAANILKGCMPFFLLKREQAEVALAFQATVRHAHARGLPVGLVEQRENFRNELKRLKHVPIEFPKTKIS